MLPGSTSFLAGAGAALSAGVDYLRLACFRGGLRRLLVRGRDHRSGPFPVNLGERLHTQTHRFFSRPTGRLRSVTTLPLPGCCNSCHEPVTQRQKSVLFEGPNLRYPDLGEGTAVFHTRELCRWDARGYDEVWAKAAPGRVQKFPGWVAGEAMLKLIEISNNFDPETERGLPVTLHLVGGAHDGACMEFEMEKEYRELYYTEPVRQPRKAEPGIWYEHAADCPCGAAGSGRMCEGAHTYRPRAGVEA